MKDETLDLAVNIFIILGKLFLHKNRCLKRTVKLIKKKNALILSTLTEDVKLSENP